MLPHRRLKCTSQSARHSIPTLVETILIGVYIAQHWSRRYQTWSKRRNTLHPSFGRRGSNLDEATANLAQTRSDFTQHTWAHCSPGRQLAGVGTRCIETRVQHPCESDAWHDTMPAATPRRGGGGAPRLRRPLGYAKRAARLGRPDPCAASHRVVRCVRSFRV